MRNIIILTALFLALISSYVSAQMGHGMMRERGMMGEEYMRGMREEGQMMDHKEMMGMMTDMTGQVTSMMEDVARIMRQSSPTDKEKIYRLADIMRDIASEMNRMSFMMERGDVKEEEMKDLQMRIRELDSRLRKEAGR